MSRSNNRAERIDVETGQDRLSHVDNITTVKPRETEATQPSELPSETEPTNTTEPTSTSEVPSEQPKAEELTPPKPASFTLNEDGKGVKPGDTVMQGERAGTVVNVTLNKSGTRNYLIEDEKGSQSHMSGDVYHKPVETAIDEKPSAEIKPKDGDGKYIQVHLRGMKPNDIKDIYDRAKVENSDFYKDRSIEGYENRARSDLKKNGIDLDELYKPSAKEGSDDLLHGVKQQIVRDFFDKQKAKVERDLASVRDAISKGVVTPEVAKPRIEELSKTIKDYEETGKKLNTAIKQRGSELSDKFQGRKGESIQNFVVRKGEQLKMFSKKVANDMKDAQTKRSAPQRRIPAERTTRSTETYVDKARRQGKISDVDVAKFKHAIEEIKQMKKGCDLI